MPERFFLQIDHNDIHNFGVRHFQALLLFLILAVNFNIKMTLVTLSLPEILFKEKTIEEAALALGSLNLFFLGFMISSIGIGFLGMWWDNKWLMFLALFYSSVTTFLLPTAVHYGSPLLYTFLRFTLGLSQGMLLPMIIGLIGRWYPPYERTTFIAFIFGGRYLGIVFARIYMALITSKLFPWTSFCYFAGASGLMTSVLWSFYGAHEPDKCSYISASEKEFIYRYNDVDQGIVKSRVNWKQMLTSLPFYALAQVHIAYNFGFWIILNDIPQYLYYVYGLHMEEVGVMSLVPYITSMIFAVPLAFVIELMVRKRILSLAFARKLLNSVGMMGTAWCIICFTYGTDKTLTLFMNTLQISLTIFVSTGFYCNHADIAPNFACLTMALSTGVAQISSIFISPLIKAIVVDPSSLSQWNKLLYLTATVFVVSDIIYLLFGSTDIQSFNYTGYRRPSAFENYFDAKPTRIPTSQRR
ncbi:hypothetical protein O3M35_001104 [Rhynocoris fuscipes]|uniref:Major facilitator superfamily (MFS) profile domain-containing protein n=1 Tax=Rhynocoris fuscipes TaxID=488301 RepID=A0AAW1DP60_9HEMI